MAMSAHEINRRATGEIVETAEAMRRGLIRDTYDLITQSLDAQQQRLDTLALEGYTDGDIIEYLVIEDEVLLPFRGNDPQKALMVLLKEHGNPSDTEGLRLFLPVDDRYRTDEYDDPSLLRIPEYMVAKRTHKDGVSAWYIVRPEGLIPYIPEDESGGETIADGFEADDITDELIARQLGLQVDTAIATTGKLREDFVNFTQVPVLYEVAGQPESIVVED